MILHPIVPALLIADLAAVALMISAALPAGRIAAGWRPGDPSADQLGLERNAESVSLRMRWAAALFLLGGLALAAAISGVLPSLVPGAMCGTGVVQATDGAAGRALALRLLALLILAGWRTLDRLDRAAPTSPLTPQAVRLALLAVPVAAVAAWSTAAAMLRLDVHTPVDCCAAVFDQVRAGSAGTGGLAWTDGRLVGIAVSLGGLSAVAAAIAVRSPRRPIASVAAPLAMIAVPFAAAALTRVLAAYHYGVLHHHCPWCLFLADHGLVGYPLFGSLLLILLQAVALATAVGVIRNEPELDAAAAASVRRSAILIGGATVLFWILAAGPALLWRWSHGVWISG